MAWVLGCGATVPPPPPLAPRADSKAATPKEDPARGATLAFAVPSDVVMFTEYFDVEAGHPLVEQLRMALGGNETPGVLPMVNSISTIATATTDPNKAAESATLVQVRDAAVVTAWLGGAGLELVDTHNDAQIYAANHQVHVAWMPKHRLMIIGLASRIPAFADAASGSKSIQSTIGESLRVPDGVDNLIAFNLPVMTPLFGPLVAATTHAETGTRFQAKTTSEPLLENISLKAMDTSAIASRVPADTAFFLTAGVPLPALIDSLRQRFGDTSSLQAPVRDLVSAVDGATTVFGMVDPTASVELDDKGLRGALVGVVAKVRAGSRLDPAMAQNALAALGWPAVFGSTVSVHDGYVLLAVGDPKLGSKATAALRGEHSLASEKKYIESASASADAQLRLWVDGAALAHAVRGSLSKSQQAMFSALPTAASSLAVRTTSANQRWNHELTGKNVMAMTAFAGVTVGLAIYGVRKYLASTKIAEAKATMRAIGRAAVARHAKDKRLCKSSIAVPTAVPSGTRYASTADEWTGTNVTGWTCLGFSLNDVLRYRFRYVGPGDTSVVTNEAVPKNAIEIVAEGDLDGDGLNSVFVLGGRVIAGKLKLDDEFAATNVME